MSGSANTAVGRLALYNNMAGADTAVGFGALQNNTTGIRNTAVGYQALLNNTIGTNNTAVGFNALQSDNSGANTAIGSFALQNDTSSGDTAIGSGALSNHMTGQQNTAVGSLALLDDTTGSLNTAVGSEALRHNISGQNNTAVGRSALFNNTTANNNIGLGQDAGGNITTTGDNIDIGNSGVAGDSGTMRLGAGLSRTFIAGIRGVTTGNNNAIPVLIDSAGQLGTASSSRQFKTDIKPIDQASESILALKPVIFRYKVHNDTTPQFGLIAEEVAEVNPDLVIFDPDGRPYTVRYDAVNAMLLNEFLKEHKAVGELKAALQEQETIIAGLKCDGASDKNTISDLKKALETVVKRLNEQDIKIQSVSRQVELTRTAPQVIANIR